VSKAISDDQHVEICVPGGSGDINQVLGLGLG
jgi:hypothetical protein